MNTYERGFVDGIRESLRLMEQEESIDFGPGKILKKIEELTRKPNPNLKDTPLMPKGASF